MKDEAKPIGEPNQGWSAGKKLLLGCGCLTVLGMLVCGGIAGVGAWYGIQMAGDFTEPFEAQGYERIDGQQVTETARVESPRLYVAQQLAIQQGSTADLAILCQMAELHGTFEGDIDFMGQMLQVKPDAVVRGDIRIKNGQMITVEGVVEGEITGSYQMLDDRRGTDEAAADFEVYDEIMLDEPGTDTSSPQE